MGEQIDNWEQFSEENINSKIQETDGLIERINKLVDFLDKCDDETKVLAGDIMGYICGYTDVTSEPEDEIEIFN